MWRFSLGGEQRRLGFGVQQRGFCPCETNLSRTSMSSASRLPYDDVEAAGAELAAEEGRAMGTRLEVGLAAALAAFGWGLPDGAAFEPPWFVMSRKPRRAGLVAMATGCAAVG